MTKPLPDPDFTQTCWPTIENKLGRKMSPEENQKFMYRAGGMFKEWFFDRLNECVTTEQSEQLLTRWLSPRTVNVPKAQSTLLSRVLIYLFG